MENQSNYKHRTTPTFAQALRHHKTCALAKEEFAKKGDVDSGSLVWEALVTSDPIVMDTFAEAVRLTMPIDAIPVVRSTSGVSASFAFERMCIHYQPTGNFFDMAKAGWVDFEERRRIANTVQEGYGCDLSASWELARDISQVRDKARVEEIAKLAGRMYKALQGARKAPSDEPHETVGVKVGGDIERLVASEVTQLFDPDMSDAAAIRILEKQSQQYKMKGQMAASRGPLVIAVDESGSMHDDGLGDRNSWAKACALALTRVAHEGGRMVVVVHFASATTHTVLAPGDNQALLHMTRHFLGGGTDHASAFVVANEKVTELAQTGHVGADIIMVTDGETSSSQHAAIEHVLKLVLAKGIRLWTVAIECRIADTSPLVKYATDVIRVGGTDRADLVAQLRDAAINTVSAADQQANDARNLN